MPKRFSTILLAMLLLLSLVACDFAGAGGGTTTTATTPASSTTTTTSTATSATEPQQSAAPDSNALQVHYIDCGQADSILILAPTGESMLIDTGDSENESRDAVLAYLQAKQIEKLDWLVLTHPHADHIGGAEQVLKQVGADKVLMPDKVHTTKLYERVLDAILDTNATLVTISDKAAKDTALYDEGMDPQVVAVGSTIELGGARFRILSPVTYDYGSNLNNYSIIMRMEYGSHSFLFTGDAEMVAEEDAIARFGADAFRCNVLKSGHHGSDTSSAQALVRATGAALAVISVGEGNDYGHPCAVTLDKYAAAGMRVYRTDLLGTVVLQTTGTVLSVVGETTVDTAPPATSATSGSSSTAPAPSEPAAGLLVHAIPCGAGEAFLLTSPDGKHMLIDAGSNNNTQRDALQTYLRAQGVTELEWLVLTNNHENHIGGAAMVVSNFLVKNLLITNKAHTSQIYAKVIDEALDKVGAIHAVGENESSGLADMGLTPQSMAVGSTISLGADVTVEVLGPTRYTGVSKLGNTSIVLRVTYGTTAFLFTGNIDETVEAELLDAYGTDGLSATVLKVANHGSQSSNSASFLAAVGPKLALLSANAAAEQALVDRLQTAGVETLYQTVTDGAVVLESNGTTVVQVTA